VTWIYLLLSLSFLAGDSLEELAEAGRWDDIIVEANERLDEDSADHAARYWVGRAWLERGQALLASSNSVFARDLARSSLTRAVTSLGMVPAGGGDSPAGDAHEWRVYARYLLEDAALAGDLEAWVTDGAEGAAYGAFLRGLLSQREDDADAGSWFALACAMSPERGEFHMARTGEAIVRGRQAEALESWQAARAAGVLWDDLLSALLAILPAAQDASARLALLNDLAAEEGGQEDGPLAWYRAHALEQLGRPGEAESLLARATERRSVGVDRAQARLLLNLGRGEDALPLLEPWIGTGDLDAIADMANIADTLASDHRWTAALGAYDIVLERNGRHEWAARNRAITLSQAGMEEQAWKAWSDLTIRHADRADILNDAALFYEGAGNRKQARSLWEQALALGGSTDARENLASHLRLEDPKRAQSLLEEVLNTDQTRDRALFLRLLVRQTDGSLIEPFDPR
jgi:tetratricopeptide (TPR) repeat protein